MREHRATSTTRRPAGSPSSAPRSPRRPPATPGYVVEPQQVVVTNGGKHAVYNTFQTLLDPGDEVLLPAPYWTTYPESIALADGVPVVAARPPREAGFRVTVEQLDAACTPRTKALLFVSPSNPTGAVYPPDEVEAIGRWAVERGVWVITDEIYEHLTYGDHRFTSMPIARSRARRHVRRAQRRRQDVRDDRVARRLDDRAARRDRRRGQPAVAPDVERRQRVAARRARGGERRPRPPSPRCAPRSSGAGA